MSALGSMRRWHRRGELGQAMVEYASISTILLLTGLAIGTSSSIVPRFFTALQGYVDLFFYALNLAVG